jgi:hypothetical protein
MIGEEKVKVNQKTGLGTTPLTKAKAKTFGHENFDRITG